MRSFDWQSKMSHALATRRKKPFVWGTHDCGLFACDITEAVCGIDFAAPFRYRYKTRRGAYMALKAYSGGGLTAVAEKISGEHNLEEVQPLLARRGDLILARRSTVESSCLSATLGVCLGEGVAFVANPGFILLPIMQDYRAWRTP